MDPHRVLLANKTSDIINVVRKDAPNNFRSIINIDPDNIINTVRAGNKYTFNLTGQTGLLEEVLVKTYLDGPAIDVNEFVGVH